jgi:hypothetical protein
MFCLNVLWFYSSVTMLPLDVFNFCVSIPIMNVLQAVTDGYCLEHIHCYVIPCVGNFMEGKAMCV